MGTNPMGNTRKKRNKRQPSQFPRSGITGGDEMFDNAGLISTRAILA
jgi:hypothetical protein